MTAGPRDPSRLPPPGRRTSARQRTGQWLSSTPGPAPAARPRAPAPVPRSRASGSRAGEQGGSPSEFKLTPRHSIRLVDRRQALFGHVHGRLAEAAVAGAFQNRVEGAGILHADDRVAHVLGDI